MGALLALAIAAAATTAAPLARAAEEQAVLEVFSRPGCPHCAKAESWLEELKSRRPSLRVLRHDITRDPAAAARLRLLLRREGHSGTLVPSFVVRGRLVVGFRDGATTGRRLEDLLSGAGAEAADEVDVPVFGRVSAARSGLLVFTLAVGLAAGVNLVEMLCTAGLPAVYTSVLASHHLGFWRRQGYLLLYIAAYMLDDGLMTAAAVATLSVTRLQERGGRVLQMISGAVLAALGLALIFRPEWLN